MLWVMIAVVFIIGVATFLVCLWAACKDDWLASGLSHGFARSYGLGYPRLDGPGLIDHDGLVHLRDSVTNLEKPCRKQSAKALSAAL